MKKIVTFLVILVCLPSLIPTIGMISFLKKSKIPVKTQKVRFFRKPSGQFLFKTKYNFRNILLLFNFKRFIALFSKEKQANDIPLPVKTHHFDVDQIAITIDVSKSFSDIINDIQRYQVMYQGKKTWREFSVSFVYGQHKVTKNFFYSKNSKTIDSLLLSIALFVKINQKHLQTYLEKSGTIYSVAMDVDLPFLFF